MQVACAQMTGQRCFGVSLRELAAGGAAPVVLQDCLRWLALRGLTTPGLFASPAGADKRKLLALRHLYDTGRRPLRSKSCRDKDPHLIASLLLYWLGSLPEPLFPAELVPELVQSQQSDYYDERLAAVRTLLKRSEPFVVEALFPLFELLHHYWINQADRDSCLQELGRLLAPAVFGSPRAHHLPPEDGGLLSDTVEMLVSEYRPLFTQPFNLRRYEADAARQAAAQAQAAEALRAAEASGGAPLGSPLLTPIRCQRLSVMEPEGASPFSDCCATPLAPESPVSAFLTAGSEAAPGGLAAFQRQPPLSLLALPPGGGAASAAAVPAAGEAAAAGGLDQQLEQAFSDLLESTVSGMLFEWEAPAGGEPVPAAACDQPMSPVAVLRGMVSDGGDSSDGSDCDAPMAPACSAPCNRSPFAWSRGAARELSSC